ncbi:hypothetical protein HU200_065070 [Digitaria exilis]|uniref:Major facilitator superfamily (MFS) profile domain-containing protein n=1 Tax=Digitaria exilis TaxID=1010633 RepID=A0A835DXS1_9POAL|nr:hypothetical protein HU200_065070 [Digitaria exilis]
MAVTAALNGVGLALQIPAIYAFVADSVDGASRGVAFGWLAVAGKAGTVAGTSLGLLMAPTSFLGLPGWRLAFLLLGVLGAAVGVSIRAFAASDAAAKARVSVGPTATAKPKPVRQELQEFAREAKAVMRVPSFQVIIAQGLTGSFPWSALLFTPMWLELVGFTHGETAALMTLFKLATSAGALFGGKMGDALARRFKNSGRIVLSQISSGSAIPLAGVLLLALPNDPSATARHGAALFVLGIMASWNGTATNSPILAEIVPPRAMTTVFALDRTFEAVLASFAPPVVGMLAERLYGYKLPTSGGVEERAEGVDVEMERHNALSLARAIYTSVAIPMALCCSIYSFLYCTYPRDREMARAEAARDRGGGHGGEEGSDSEDEGDGERKLLPQRWMPCHGVISSQWREVRERIAESQRRRVAGYQQPCQPISGSRPFSSPSLCPDLSPVQGSPPAGAARVDCLLSGGQAAAAPAQSARGGPRLSSRFRRLAALRGCGLRALGASSIRCIGRRAATRPPAVRHAAARLGGRRTVRAL